MSVAIVTPSLTHIALLPRTKMFSGERKCTCYNRHMPDLDRFAAWLKHRRIALNFTRDELARRAHCSVSTLRRLEAGDLRASEQLAASLAKALNLPAEQLEPFTRF